MELFAKLYSSLLVFVYHCFDRIVIHGYLSGLSRPEQVVYFFHEVLGMPMVDKELLRQRTNDYQNWVEAYARNHNLPIQWAEKESAKRIRFYRHCAGWRRPTLTGSTSSTKAWNRAAPFVSPCRSIPPRTPIIGLWPSSGVASPITTSMSGMNFSADHCPRGQFLPVPCHLLAQLSLLHRAGTEAQRNRFSQEGQRLPCRGRCGGSASSR